MADDGQRGARFWPVFFLTAFLLGAILWGFWMIRVIAQTRARRARPLFVPLSNPPAFTPTPFTNPNTNAAGTNGVSR